MDLVYTNQAHREIETKTRTENHGSANFKETIEIIGAGSRRFGGGCDPSSLGTGGMQVRDICAPAKALGPPAPATPSEQLAA